jgi:hypothetical protein
VIGHCVGGDDSELVRYGKLYLKPPHYQSLSQIDLVKNAVNEEVKEAEEAAVSHIANCEYSMEG